MLSQVQKQGGQGSGGPQLTGAASLVKGMRQLEKKNIITDYQSRKYKWEDLGVPTEVIHALEDLKMDKPSLIQAQSIKEIVPEKSTNFMF